MKPDTGPTREPRVPAMDLTEFKAAGYLMEVNRRFFHPLGLALSVKTNTDGEVTLHNIWDGRDDPEGFVFEDLTEAEALRAVRISDELDRRLKVREQRLGYGVQPL